MTAEESDSDVEEQSWQAEREAKKEAEAGQYLPVL